MTPTALKSRNKKLKGAVLTTLALALHNAPEGLAVGFATLQKNVQRKVMVAAAISLHNIPEGIAVAAAMYNATGNAWKSFWIATLTGLVEPVSAVISVALLAPFLSKSVMQLAPVFVAGVMITVSIKELIPQALEDSPSRGAIGLIVGIALVKIGLLFLTEHST